MNPDPVNRTILLADDDSDDAEIFSMVLLKVDPSIKFIHLPNGLAVLDYLKEKDTVAPDLIFLDINMPEMNGWQCLQSLKADPATSVIPVMMYTTSSHPRDRDIAVNLGAVAFITKPSDYKALEILLRDIAANLKANVNTTARTLR